MRINSPLARTLLLTSLFIFTGCEEQTPEVSVNDHLNLAKLYFKQGSFRASLIEGRNALQMEPNNIKVLTTMTDVLLKLNDYPTAEKIIKVAIEADKNNENLKIPYVISLLHQGKKTQAIKTFNNIDKTKITQQSNYLKLQGDILFATNRRTEAKQAYLKAMKADENNIDAILAAAKTSLILKQDDEVKTFTELAIEKAPKNIEAMIWQAQIFMLEQNHAKAEDILSHAMIELERYDTLTANKFVAIDMLAKTLVAQGKIEESLFYSNYLAKSRPGQLRASYDSAIELLSKEGDITKAEVALENILKQAPKHKSSNILLGLINFEKGDYTAAEDYLSKFATDENTPLRSKKILALTKIRLNKIDEALAIINTNLKSHPDDADLYALQGNAYLITKDFSRSVNKFRKAIQLDSKNPIFHIQLARTHLAEKNTSAALSEAKAALKLKPNSDQAKQVLVSAYFQENDINKAIQITDEWIKESPENILALSVSASLELKKNNLSKAKTRLLKVLTINPYNLQANLSLVRFDIRDKNYDKAYERISTVLSKQPENLPTLNILLKLALNSPTEEKAIQTLNAVFSQHPLAVNSRLAFAQLKIQKKHYEEALPVLEDVLKVNGKNYQAYLLKAKSFAALKKIEEAKNIYNILGSLYPDNPVANAQLALLYFRQNDYKNALAEANKAIAIDQNYIPAHVIVYNCSIKSKDLVLAQKSLAAIKKINPQSHVPYEMEADYQISTKKYRNAQISLKKAWQRKQNVTLANKILYTKLELNENSSAYDAWKELASKNQKDLKLQILYSLALLKNKQFKQAQVLIEKLLESYPDNAILLNNLANVYFELNDKRSITTAEKALVKFPDNPAILDTVGWIYVKQFKNYDKGIPLIRSAYDKTKDSQIKQHLVGALKATGKIEEVSKIK